MLSTIVKTAVKKQPSVILVGPRTTTSRAVGSKCRFFTTKTPQRPPQTASKDAASPKNIKPSSNATTSSTTTTNNTNINEMSNPPDVNLEVTSAMKMSNLALATVLVGFVGGVWYYSMMSVGQQEKNTEDPLAQLKMEAQEAMDQQQKENAPDERAQQLLQEFTRGEHDPDRAELDAMEELDRLEEEEAAAKKKKKKSWWKFW